jgi:hypothetical protein
MRTAIDFLNSDSASNTRSNLARTRLGISREVMSAGLVLSMVEKVLCWLLFFPFDCDG